MKYKVGDKVKVRSDLRVGKSYGEHAFVHDMFKFRGKIVTIESVWKQGYRIEEDTYWWTDEMLEPVEEMSAEEAIKLSGKMCSSSACYECPVFKSREKYGEMCNVFRKEHAEEYLEILKQWKADHEKKEVDVEFAWYAVIKDEKGSIVHEERIESPLGSNKEYLENNKEILAKYCSEHNGKFYELTERRCVVKE